MKEKISNLNKEVTDLRKSHTDEKIKLERTIDSLSLEKSRVIKNENTLNLNVNSLDSEILLKDEQIDVKEKL